MRASGGSTEVCPRCGQRSPVRLYKGQVCAACRSADAWSQNDRLVIGREDIAAAEARRQREQRAWPVAPIAMAGLALLLAAAAGYSLAGLFRAQPLAGLDVVIAALRQAAMQSTLWGAGSLVVALVALWRLGRSRHRHRLRYGVVYLSAALTGAAAGATGGLHWLSYSGPSGWRHLTMPPLVADAHQSASFARLAHATVAIVSTGADGDAREPGLGMGVVIARDEDHAWLMTCSHVVIPGIAVGALRTPEDTRPVWVQLFDGRSVIGRVVWIAKPPLDVVLVEVAISDPPAPVALATTTGELGQGSAVMFLPNPYRNGWQIHYGDIERRRTHDTSAGIYSLLYTTLPVQPGDSGGGLYDGRGMLIGINTWSHMGAGEMRGISLPAETWHALIEAVQQGRIETLGNLLPAMESSGEQR